jgi:transcriptional regulator with XRE-family HTH domain
VAQTLTSPEYQHLRRLLVEARGRAGLTQAEVAVRLNRAQSFVSKYEQGERRLDVVDFVHVCNCLETSAAQVLAEVIIKVRK